MKILRWWDVRCSTLLSPSPYIFIIRKCATYIFTHIHISHKRLFTSLNFFNQHLVNVYSFFFLPHPMSSTVWQRLCHLSYSVEHSSCRCTILLYGRVRVFDIYAWAFEQWMTLDEETPWFWCSIVLINQLA